MTDPAPRDKVRPEWCPELGKFVVYVGDKLLCLGKDPRTFGTHSSAHSAGWRYRRDLELKP